MSASAWLPPARANRSASHHRGSKPPSRRDQQRVPRQATSGAAVGRPVDRSETREATVEWEAGELYLSRVPGSAGAAIAAIAAIAASGPRSTRKDFSCIHKRFPVLAFWP